MKKLLFYAISLILFSITLVSCEMMGDIFGAGVYTGIILVVVTIAIIMFAVSRIFRKR